MRGILRYLLGEGITLVKLKGMEEVRPGWFQAPKQGVRLGGLGGVVAWCADVYGVSCSPCEGTKSMDIGAWTA